MAYQYESGSFNSKVNINLSFNKGNLVASIYAAYELKRNIRGSYASLAQSNNTSSLPATTTSSLLGKAFGKALSIFGSLFGF